MLEQVFHSKAKTITFAAILLVSSTLISRILGLVRDALLAGYFGAGRELDIYYAAFTIPDLVYSVVITGGITAAFLPVFAEYFKKDQSEGWSLVNNLLNFFSVLLILLSGALALFSPQLIGFVTPGFSEQERILTTTLNRIMFLSPIFLGISSLFSGILQYFNLFLAYSLAPIFYNLGIIIGIVFLLPVLGLKGLALGVVLGAILHWLIQLPAVPRTGYRYRAFLNIRHPGLAKVLGLMAPRVVGQASYQLNFIIITAIASTLAVGSIAIFNLSFNLQYIPIGLIGVSFALAAFPELARAWAEGDKKKFFEDFSSIFKQISFLTLPASVLMFLLRAQIVRLILGRGEFGWMDTRLTAASLGLFSLGIFAAGLAPFLVRAFFSLQDTRTPVAIGVITMIFNIGLSFILVWYLSFDNFLQKTIVSLLKLQDVGAIGVVGLPLALSLSAILQFLLLLFFLNKKAGEINLDPIWRSLLKISIGTFFMAITVYFSLRFALYFVNPQTSFGIGLQSFLAVAAGTAVYIFSGIMLKSPEIKMLYSSVSKQFSSSS